MLKSNNKLYVKRLNNIRQSLSNFQPEIEVNSEEVKKNRIYSHYLIGQRAETVSEVIENINHSANSEKFETGIKYNQIFELPKHDTGTSNSLHDSIKVNDSHTNPSLRANETKNLHLNICSSKYMTPKDT